MPITAVDGTEGLPPSYYSREDRSFILSQELVSQCLKTRSTLPNQQFIPLLLQRHTPYQHLHKHVLLHFKCYLLCQSQKLLHILILSIVKTADFQQKFSRGTFNIAVRMISFNMNSSLHLPIFIQFTQQCNLTGLDSLYGVYRHFMHLPPYAGSPKLSSLLFDCWKVFP